MAEQSLRLQNLRDSKRTNPYYSIKKRFKRLYVKFQPDRYYW